MSDHLPECPAYGIEKWAVVDECGPCNWLRASEQRVWDEAYACGFNAGRDHGEKVGRAEEQFRCLVMSGNRSHWREEGVNAGYAAGLDAARKAVKALECPECSVDAAIVAIDALRGER